MSDTNPLLENLKLPGRIFQLPSRGLFYHDGELSPSVKDGEIHVHAMSAMDEINMKNPDQLFSGAAVETVFKRCVSGVEKPAQLLSKDVDAIMLFLRTVTYGPSYEFTATHTCKDAKSHSYVSDIDQIIGNMALIDPTVIENISTLVAVNGQKISVAPTRYQQVTDLLKNNENKKDITVEGAQENLKFMLLSVITSVDGITDKKQIGEWIDIVPAPIINKIAEKIDDVNAWGPSLIWSCVCKDCEQSFDVDLPINPVSFFTD